MKQALLVTFFVFGLTNFVFALDFNERLRDLDIESDQFGRLDVDYDSEVYAEQKRLTTVMRTLRHDLIALLEEDFSPVIIDNIHWFNRLIIKSISSKAYSREGWNDHFQLIRASLAVSLIIDDTGPGVYSVLSSAAVAEAGRTGDFYYNAALKVTNIYQTAAFVAVAEAGRTGDFYYNTALEVTNANQAAAFVAVAEAGRTGDFYYNAALEVTNANQAAAFVAIAKAGRTGDFYYNTALKIQ
jgi:hypothetical protein